MNRTSKISSEVRERFSLSYFWLYLVQHRANGERDLVVVQCRNLVSTEYLVVDSEIGIREYIHRCCWCDTPNRVYWGKGDDIYIDQYQSVCEYARWTMPAEYIWDTSSPRVQACIGLFERY
jgi:hypothetical protein